MGEDVKEVREPGGHVCKSTVGRGNTNAEAGAGVYLAFLRKARKSSWREKPRGRVQALDRLQLGLAMLPRSVSPSCWLPENEAHFKSGRAERGEGPGFLMALLDTGIS